MKVVIVDKTGTLKTQKIKNFVIDELYKKCLLRKPNDFKKRHTWNVKINKKDYFISLYAKDTGRATTENKYDLPPPVDKVIYYGSMVLVNFNCKDGDETDATDLTTEEWEKIYEKLFGGFEDIENTDDEEEEDELENVPKKYLTKKGGYLKDGFVVDTASEEEQDESNNDAESDEDLDEDNIIEQDNINENDVDNLNDHDEEVHHDEEDEDDEDGEENDENENESNDEESEENDESYNQDSGEESDENDNSSELCESEYYEYSDEK